MLDVLTGAIWKPVPFVTSHLWRARGNLNVGFGIISVFGFLNGYLDTEAINSIPWRRGGGGDSEKAICLGSSKTVEHPFKGRGGSKNGNKTA
ncbi:unnamed protein product [Ixodes pacificus]